MKIFNKSVFLGMLVSLQTYGQVTVQTAPSTITYDDETGQISIQIDWVVPKSGTESPTIPVIEEPGDNLIYGSSKGLSPSSLSSAKSRFANAGGNPKNRDCDKISGYWVCSNLPDTDADPSLFDLEDIVVAPERPVTSVVSNGQVEEAFLPQEWQFKTDLSGYQGSGYIEYIGQDRRTPGADYVEIIVDVPESGDYKFQFRSYIAKGTSGTEHNDTFVSIDGSDWTKAYTNTKNNWSWQTNTVDFNPEPIIASLRAGQVSIKLNGRSNGHAIDAIRLQRVGSTNNQQSSSSDKFIVFVADVAGDPDDIHAAVAAKHMQDSLGLDLWAVTGAHGHQKRSAYIQGSDEVWAALWGSQGFSNAYKDWSKAIATTSNKITNAHNAGKPIYIADGAPHDFTADLLRSLPQSIRNQINVIGHSQWNIDQTAVSNYNYVRNNSRWKRIEDGNKPNATANLNTKSVGSFVNKALSSNYSSVWRAAFDYLKPENRVDFSDIVTLLEAVGIGKDRVGDINSFASEFIR